MLCQENNTFDVDRKLVGFFNFDLKRELKSAENEFTRLHNAIFALVEPEIPDNTITLTKNERKALKSFQSDALSRVRQARNQAKKVQLLAVNYHSQSGPLLYRRPRSKRAKLWWQSRIESLNQLEIVFNMIMGPYEN